MAADGSKNLTGSHGIVVAVRVAGNGMPLLPQTPDLSLQRGDTDPVDTGELAPLTRLSFPRQDVRR